MLVIGFVRAAFWVLEFVTSLLPAADVAGFTHVFEPVKNLIATVLEVNTVLPIDAMLDAFALYSVLVIALQSQGVVRKIWNLVPVIGGGGS